MTTSVLLPNYINGGWSNPEAGEVRDVTNPSTGELLAQVPLAGAIVGRKVGGDLRPRPLGRGQRRVEDAALSRRLRLTVRYGLLARDGRCSPARHPP